jgi:mannose-1-phosphate guanylyltransferase
MEPEQQVNWVTNAKGTSMQRSIISQPSFWAVIPAGGAGTRLWPVSRVANPKFLLPFLDDGSLLQQTAQRLSPLAPPNHTLVVCGPAHAAAIARQLPDLPEAHLVIEPSPKGTGPAIGLAAALIVRSDPDAIMGSFAADHDVRDESAFIGAIAVAIEAAKDDWLVTVGIRPTRPETGYGYVERTVVSLGVMDAGTAYRVARFVEKPSLGRATTYVASGRFLWNASMFVWRVRTFLDELARLQPALHARLLRIAEAWDSPDREEVFAAEWAELPSSTIDQGVMERAGRIAVVPAEMGWSDVGDWHGLSVLMGGDDHGNSVRGQCIQVKTTNSAVWSVTGRLVAMVGVDNLIAVDTPDALLIADRTRTQDVREIVALLPQFEMGDLC